MKKQIISGLALLSLMLASATGAYAQLARRVEAIVPFEFTVSGKLLPDGKYTVTQNSQSSLKIEGADGSALALALYAQSNTTTKEAKLVFDRIGDHYFLTQIWEPGTHAGSRIPRCKMERELIKGTLARSSPDGEHQAGPELVYVTGRVL